MNVPGRMLVEQFFMYWQGLDPQHGRDRAMAALAANERREHYKRHGRPNKYRPHQGKKECARRRARM